MATKKSCTFLFLSACLGLVLAYLSCSRNSNFKATLTEKKEVILTYPYFDPDPVPIFSRKSMGEYGEKLYPYFFFDGYSAQPEQKEWNVIWLENPFIQLAVLPEVGGKVWGAKDKLSGNNFLYWNQVLKFRQIALRGPWTSGGLEFNFGIVGHAPTTASPVNYTTRKKSDGSVTIFIGNFDLPSRTRWTVSITLPPSRTAFETRAYWHNLTPFFQSYYYWSCPAVSASDDLKFIFPGRWLFSHGYSEPLETWPVDAEGRDLSWYRNNAFAGSKSHFTVGEFANFYGVWYENKNFGSGHWARYEDMPGRKIWIWDLSKAGQIWVNLLTDSDGQYSEPQAGRMLNQSDHGDFYPGVSETWSELWFPYQGIGPMIEATPEAVLGASNKNGQLELGVYSLGFLREEITIKREKTEIVKEKINLRPGETWTRKLPINPAEQNYEVILGDKLLFNSNKSEKYLERPLGVRDIQGDSAQAFYLLGRNLERERNYRKAIEQYLNCVRKEPRHISALSRLSGLYTRAGEPEEGIQYARRALEIYKYDPEANYFYGVASRRLGRLTDAEETFSWAARSPEFRVVALRQIAEISVEKGNWRKAVEFAEKAIQADPQNAAAKNVLALAYRLAGKRCQAIKLLKKTLNADPLDPIALFENYLTSRKKADLDQFCNLIRCELPHEIFLETAIFYVHLKRFEEAITILEQAPDHATVSYWLAYLYRETSPEKSNFWLKKASESSAYFVFPFREESIDVFRWASAVRPEDWKPKYYLGLIYWGKGNPDRTLELFLNLKPENFWPFYLARGVLQEEKSPEKALSDYEKAVELGKTQWRTHHALIHFFLRQNQNKEALSAARKAASLLPEYGPLKVDLIKALMASGDYEAAEEILDKIEVLPYEGATEVHGLYVQTKISLGLKSMIEKNWLKAIDYFEKSKLYPERLGTGEPFQPDFRLQKWFEAISYEKLGERARADNLRTELVDYTLKHWSENKPHDYFGVLALEKSGRQAEATKLRARAALPGPDIMKAINKFKY